MDRSRTVGGTFLIACACVVALFGLLWLLLGPGEEGVMLAGTNGRGPIAAGVSDSLWGILATFVLTTALGIALVVAARSVQARALGSILIGCASALALTYAIEVAALPWNSYEVKWSDLLDFWGLFFAAFAGLFVFGMTLALSRREVSPRRSMYRYPVAAPLLISSLAGAVAMSAVNIRVYNSGSLPDHGREILGFWGLAMGIVVSVGSFLLLRKRVPASTEIPPSISSEPRSKVGLLVTAIVAGVFGLLVTSWSMAWGVPLTSLEGAWLWPLGISPLLLSALMFRAYRRARAARKVAGVNNT